MFIFAQPDFKQVDSGGETFTINKNELTYYAFWGVDEDSIAYLRARDEIGRYDLKSNTWLKPLSADNIPTYYQYARYDSDLGKFQTYSNGGGRVALIDKDFEEIERIDQSFLHKNQYTAAASFNDQIYLFGGYGFWQTKNITTFYHPELNEWSLVSYTPNQDFPEPRHQSWSFWDKSGEVLFILGGRSITQNRDDSYAKSLYYNDLWKFNSEMNTWNLINRFSVTNPFSNINAGSFYDTGRCEEHDITYGFSFKNVEGNTIYNMFAFDGETEEIYFLGPLTDYFLSSEFIGLWVDQQSHTMHLFVKLINDVSGEDPVRHYVLNLDSMQNLREAGMSQPATIKVSDGSHGLTIGILFLLVVAAGAGIVWTRTRRNKKSEETESTETDKAEEITITKQDLPIKDLRMLELLSQKYDEDAWVTALEIEEYAFPEEKNPDYARNLRNLSFSRIQKKLSAKSDLPDEEILVSRKSEIDKRKLEYKLNLPIRLK